MPDVYRVGLLTDAIMLARASTITGEMSLSSRFVYAAKKYGTVIPEVVFHGPVT